MLLYSNGTWRPDTIRRVAGTGAKYAKPASATASLEILKGSTLAYDPAKWTPVANNNNKKAGRQQLNHTDGDGYALIIAERLEMPMESFKNVVLQNARAAAPDAKLVRDQQREVNGVPVTCMEIIGTTQGIRFHYFGYYYTGENLFDEYRADFENLLNGFAPPK